MDILLSCTIYFICFALPGIVVINSKRTTNFVNLSFFCISLLPVMFFTTFRYGIATDYFSYDEIFTYVKDYSFEQAILPSSYPREFGFKLIVCLMKSFPNSLIFGVLGLLTILPVITILRRYYRHSTFALSLALFFYMFVLYPISLNALRQCLACSFVFCGISYLFKNKILMFYLFALIAISFHFSAIVVFIIPLFWNINKNKSISWYNTILLFFLFIICLFFWQIIVKALGLETYLRYVNLKSSGSNMSFWIKFGLTSFCLLLRKRLIKYDYKNNLYINLSLVALFTYGFGFYYPFIIRCAWYFEYTNILLYASLPFVLGKSNINKAFCYIIIVIACMFWFFGIECGLFLGKPSDFMPVRFVF